MIVVFLGPPGSGKGTQAQGIKEIFKDVLHISTGDLLRQEITSGSELGRTIQATVQAGQFPGDDVVTGLVGDIVKKNAQKHIIFDGFPRTVNQAIAFDTLLGVENLKVDVVFDFNMDTSGLVERISGRFSCQECGAVYHEKTKKPRVDGTCDQCGSSRFQKRPDDTGEVLKTRLKIYEEQTLPVKDYYRNKGVLKEVDASLSQGEVASFMGAALSEAGLIRRGE